MAGLDQRKVWDFAKVVFGGGKASPTGRVRATYLRTDTDGTHWVQLAGSSEETPVNGGTFAKASPGDVVELTMGDGVLSMSGNASDPAVGEAAASRIASNVVRPVTVAVNIAQGIAEAADRVAKAVNQNFWTDTNGIHVTSVTREEWQDSEGTSYQSGPNVLINSLGQLFRDGLNNLLTMTTESGARALSIWDGAGNATANVLASFGETVTLGRPTAQHVDFGTNGIDMYAGDGSTDVLRLYHDADETSSDYDYNAGIDFCGGRAKVIVAPLDNSQWSLDVESGDSDSTRGANAGVSAIRRWASDASKFDHAYLQLDTFPGGNQPQATLACESGSGLAQVTMTTGGAANSSRVSIEAASVYVADNLVTESVYWANLPLGSNAKAFSDANAPQYCRHLGIVELIGEVSPKSEVASGGTLAIGTLPVGCRPTMRVVTLCQGSTGHVWLLTVGIDGTVQASRYRTGGTNEAMPTNAWLPLHVIFVAAES